MTNHSAVSRPPTTLQQPVALSVIETIVRRAFGADAVLRASEELVGGEVNSVYRLTLDGLRNVASSVILRVAPPPDAPLHWHEVGLMRREHAVAPYLAPLGTLAPPTLFADFTHELLPRDYLFQTLMPGENWRDIAPELDDLTAEPLWREMAGITRRLNNVQGEAFGYPPPLPCFRTWSACVAWEIEQTIADIERYGADTSAVRAVLSLVRTRPEPLDEIRVPRLAHGDLWPFNVLVDRISTLPRITAVLDGDRAYWGDPLADWTFHLLPRKATERAREVFWQAYGPRDESPEAACRWTIYEAKHTANVLAFCLRDGNTRVVVEAREHLERYASTLNAWHGDC